MKYLATVLMIFVFLGCKTSGPVVRRHKVKKMNTKTLMSRVGKQAFNCSTLSFRSSVKLHTGESGNQFKTTVRIQKDSLIWMSISPLLGIEAVRVMATVDSIKVLNRVKKTYFKGNYDFIAEQYGVELDYFMLQNLIFGNTMGLDEINRIKTSVTDSFYLISSFKARRVLKKIDKEKPRRKDDIIISHWIEPDSFRVDQVSMFDFSNNIKMVVNHSDFGLFNHLLLPLNTKVKIRGRVDVDLQFEKSSVSVDEPMRFPFKIPRKYDLVQ